MPFPKKSGREGEPVTKRALSLPDKQGNHNGIYASKYRRHNHRNSDSRRPHPKGHPRKTSLPEDNCGDPDTKFQCHKWPKPMPETKRASWLLILSLTVDNSRARWLLRWLLHVLLSYRWMVFVFNSVILFSTQSFHLDQCHCHGE